MPPTLGVASTGVWLEPGSAQGAAALWGSGGSLPPLPIPLQASPGVPLPVDQAGLPHREVAHHDDLGDLEPAARGTRGSAGWGADPGGRGVRGVGGHHPTAPRVRSAPHPGSASRLCIPALHPGRRSSSRTPVSPPAPPRVPPAPHSSAVTQGSAPGSAGSHAAPTPGTPTRGWRHRGPLVTPSPSQQRGPQTTPH